MPSILTAQFFVKKGNSKYFTMCCHLLRSYSKEANLKQLKRDAEVAEIRDARSRYSL